MDALDEQQLPAPTLENVARQPALGGKVKAGHLHRLAPVDGLQVLLQQLDVQPVGRLVVRVAGFVERQLPRVVRQKIVVQRNGGRFAIPIVKQRFNAQRRGGFA